MRTIKQRFSATMKRYFLLSFSIFITAFSFAQVKPSIGVKAGFSSSSIKGESATSLNNLLEFTDGRITTKSHSGFFGGVNVNVPLSEQLSFEPGLYYTQKGYEVRGSLGIKGIEFLGAGAKAQLNLQYVDLPVLLKGNFNGFQVFAGPQISYLTSGDLKTTAGVLGINLFNNKMDVTDNFNRWDMGLTGGVGYQFGNVNLSASYDHGLSKIDANQSFNAYNRGFKVGIGYKF
jgi:hypothetical protein